MQLDFRQAPQILGDIVDAMAIGVFTVNAEGEWDSAETLVVLGKHISNHGLDFYSSQPVPYRRVVVCFPSNQGEDIRLLMDLTWCRFCGHGWYENGGRFLPGDAGKGSEVRT